MPTSLPTFDEEIELYFRTARPASALDIGAGAGKYARLVREASPQTRIVGVEIDEQYATQFALRELYDQLIVADTSTLIGDPSRKFDAVIIGDCIEHLRKSAGVDLLHFLVYRCKALFVKFPAQMVQNGHAGHLSEAHLSVWSRRDFEDFDHIYLERDMMRMAIVRGYLSNAFEWLPEPFMRRLGYESCAAYYNERPARWELADLETRRRESLLRELSMIIGAEDRFILADEMASGLWEWAGPRALPFTERDGQYWGMPADDDSAIAEIQRQRDRGSRFIVFIAPTTWALKHYAGMERHLRENCACAMRNEQMAVFELI